MAGAGGVGLVDRVRFDRSAAAAFAGAAATAGGSAGGAQRRQSHAYLDHPCADDGPAAGALLGKTNICRSLDPTLTACGTPVGEAAPPADFASKNDAGGQKLTASYTDTLPLDLRVRDVFGSVTYAVEVLNRDGRAAGLSNQVHVPLAETLPAPTDFSARVTAQGVVLTWSGALLSLPSPSPIRRSYRVYRRIDGSHAGDPCG